MRICFPNPPPKRSALSTQHDLEGVLRFESDLYVAPAQFMICSLKPKGGQLSTSIRSHLELQIRVHMALSCHAPIFLFAKDEVCVRLAKWVLPVGGAFALWLVGSPSWRCPEQAHQHQRRQLVRYVVYIGKIRWQRASDAPKQQVPSKGQAGARQVPSRYRGSNQPRRGGAK